MSRLNRGDNHRSGQYFGKPKKFENFEKLEKVLDKEKEM